MSRSPLAEPGPARGTAAEVDEPLELGWRDGQMALRWWAAGMIEANQQFRRVNAHRHLTTLRAALEGEVAQSVVPAVHNDQVSAT